MVRHIFVGIDLGDKNSVSRMGVEREKTERFGFVNSRQGRARLFREAKRRAEQAGGAKIIMAYEASSCGFVLRDEAEVAGVGCWGLGPPRIGESVEARREKKHEWEGDG